MNLPPNGIFLERFITFIVELSVQLDLVLGDFRDGVGDHVLGGNQGFLDHGGRVEFGAHGRVLEAGVEVVLRALLLLILDKHSWKNKQINQ